MAFVADVTRKNSLDQDRQRLNDVNEKLGDMALLNVNEATLMESIITYVDENAVNQDGDTVNGDLTVDGELDVTGIATFQNTVEVNGNVTINGDLTVTGTTFTTETETVEISDNLLLINNGEVGPGVTAPEGYAGIEVDRGDSSDRFFFVYEESRDGFTMGKAGERQMAATREDNPTAGGFAVWNDTERRFDTSKQTIDDGGTVAEEGNVEDIAIQFAIALG